MIFYIIAMLGIEQKKGNDDHLCGRMIAYAKILPSPDSNGSKTIFDDMIKNGLFALEGDFRKQSPNAKTKREIREDVDSKLNNILQTMHEDGFDIPENVDVDSLRDRLHELSSMEVIPIPAQIGNYNNEEEILKENADVYYVGEFMGMSQAHFCLTTLPIFYQAKYRDQSTKQEMDLLNDMLSQFEQGQLMDNEDIQNDSKELFPNGLTLNTFIGDLNNLLNERVIPFLLTCENDNDYEIQISLFYNFMKDYPQQIDVSRVDHAIRKLRNQSDSKEARILLELTCKKINAIYCEDTKAAESIESEIKNLR